MLKVSHLVSDKQWSSSRIRP